MANANANAQWPMLNVRGWLALSIEHWALSIEH
jgi:hypothetical protein